MKAFLFALALVPIALSGAQPTAAPKSGAAAEVPACTRAQLLGYVPDKEEIDAHRQSPLPVIDYPWGTTRDHWGMELTLRIDESGRVACYSPKGEYGQPLQLNAARRTAIRSLQYKPFTRDGQRVPAILAENVPERELPERDVPMPDVPLADVRITLSRGGCYGACPIYRVVVHGDGRVVYEGKRFVDIEGRHEYRIPTEAVARLVESARQKNLWSTRASYVGGVTDQSFYVVTLDMGGQVHRIEDYVGAMAGMPPGVTAFEREIDEVARTDQWIHLSSEALAQLFREGFDFRSQAAADLLMRAVSGDSRDDTAMTRLVELGAPITGGQLTWRFQEMPLIELALRNHRDALLAPLIARGALETNGKPDQARIDSAFRAAIAGGRLSTVRAMWDVRGDRPHPALTFEDESEGEDGTVHRRQVPVTLMLWHAYNDTAWEGLEIAQWLALQGCDIKARAADGRTLLHIAADADDVRFVRYLLDQGLSASTPGTYDLPPLGSASNEDVALALLQAGTDMKNMDGFARYAEDSHWQRVMQWLAEHGHR